MGGREEWATTSFNFDVSADGFDRLRVRLLVERGRVLRYTAQHETQVENKTYPVVRYETAHGAPHRHTLDWAGHVVAKDWFSAEDYNRAANEAIEDIKAKWPTYRADFEGRQP